MKEILQKINAHISSVHKLRNADKRLTDTQVLEMLTDISNAVLERKQDIIDEVLTVQDEYKRATLTRLLL